MTTERDIERVLDHWFAEGPSRMPEAFLRTALERVDRLPRRRRPGVPARLLRIRFDVRLAVAAVVAVIVAGAGFAALLRTEPVGTRPSPSAAPTAFSAARTLPVDLQSSWRSVGTRKIPGSDNAAPYDIEFAATILKVQDFKADVFSSASWVGPEALALRLMTNTQYWHCAPGDVGAYSFALSSNGLVLTLAAETDACAQRAALLAGDWSRTGIGDLESGGHASNLFRPFGNGTSGAFSYTVPADWTESFENATYFSFGPRVAAGATVNLFANAVARSATGGKDVGDAVGKKPNEIADWLTGLPGLVVAARQAVTIGGLDGVMVDVGVKPGWVNPCCYSQGADGDGATLTAPVYDYPLDTFSAEDGSSMVALSTSSHARARYIVLDRGDGGFLLIDIEADDATWDQVIAEAMPVVESFTFTR